MTVTLGAPPPTPQASLALTLPVQARAHNAGCLSRAVCVGADDRPASRPAVCTLHTFLLQRACHLRLLQSPQQGHRRLFSGFLH